MAIVTLLALVVGTSGQGEIGPQRWKSLTHAPTTGTTARLALQVAEFRCTRP